MKGIGTSMERERERMRLRLVARTPAGTHVQNSGAQSMFRILVCLVYDGASSPTLQAARGRDNPPDQDGACHLPRQ